MLNKIWVLPQDIRKKSIVQSIYHCIRGLSSSSHKGRKAIKLIVVYIFPQIYLTKISRYRKKSLLTENWE